MPVTQMTGGSSNFDTAVRLEFEVTGVALEILDHVESRWVAGCLGPPWHLRQFRELLDRMQVKAPIVPSPALSDALSAFQENGIDSLSLQAGGSRETGWTRSDDDSGSAVHLPAC